MANILDTIKNILSGAGSSLYNRASRTPPAGLNIQQPTEEDEEDLAEKLRKLLEWSDMATEKQNRFMNLQGPERYPGELSNPIGIGSRLGNPFDPGSFTARVLDIPGAAAAGVMKHPGLADPTTNPLELTGAAFRGVGKRLAGQEDSEEYTLYEQVPKLFGIDKDVEDQSTKAFAVGLGAELLAPGPGELSRLGQTGEIINKINKANNLDEVSDIVKNLDKLKGKKKILKALQKKFGQKVTETAEGVKLDDVATRAREIAEQMKKDGKISPHLIARESIKQAKKEFKLKADVENMKASGLPSAKEATDAFSKKNTFKITKETMSGAREEFRMNTPEARVKYSTGLKDAFSDDTVTVYRAGEGEIKPGDYVTLSDSRASESYLSTRPGAEVLNKDVKVEDLVYGNGLKDDFIYAPEGSIKKGLGEVGEYSTEVEPPIVPPKIPSGIPEAPEGKGVRRFLERGIEEGFIPEDVSKELKTKPDVVYYDVKNYDEPLRKANEFVRTDKDATKKIMNQLLSDLSAPATEDDLIKAKALTEFAEENGDNELLKQVYEILTIKGTPTSRSMRLYGALFNNITQKQAWRRLTKIEFQNVKRGKISEELEGALLEVPEELNKINIESLQKVMDGLKKKFPEVFSRKLPQDVMETELPPVGGARKSAGGAIPKPKKGFDAAEQLAKRIKNYVDPPENTDDIVTKMKKTMVRTLFKIAKEEVIPEQAKKAPIDPLTLIKRALKDRAEYTRAWEEAQNKVMNEFVIESDGTHNIELEAKLKEFIESELKEPFAKSQVEQVVKEEVKGLEYTLSELVKEHYSVVEEQGTNLLKKIVNRTGLSEEEAAPLVDEIVAQFSKLTKAKKIRILENKFFSLKKTPLRKSYIGKILELSNLGAFGNSRYYKETYDILGVPQVSPELAKFIDNQADLIQKAIPGSQERKNLVQEMLRRISDDIPIENWELYDAWRYNSALTNYFTQARNLFGNAYQVMVRRPADVASKVAVDIWDAFRTGSEREAYLSDIPLYYKNLMAAWPEAMEGFQAIWRGEDVIRNPDMMNTIRGSGKTIRKQTALHRMKNEPITVFGNETPLNWSTMTVGQRVSEGADIFWSTMLKQSQQAVLESHGMRPDQAEEIASKMAERYLFRQRASAVMTDAEAGTLQKGIASLTQWMLEGREKRFIGPAMKIAFLFLNTTQNILGQSLADIPVLGWIGAKQTKEVRARQLTGLFFAGLGAYMAATDRSTFSPPEDKDARRVWYDLHIPFSFNFGGKEIPVSYFGTSGLSMMISAAIAHIMKEDPDSIDSNALEKASNLMSGLLNYTFTEQSSIKGGVDAMSILSGEQDKNLTKSAQFMMGQFAPYWGLVRGLSHQLDGIFRKPDTFKEMWMRDMPILSKEIDPYFDSSGSPARKGPLWYVLPWSIKDVPEGTEKIMLEDKLFREKGAKYVYSAIKDKSMTDKIQFIMGMQTTDPKLASEVVKLMNDEMLKLTDEEKSMRNKSVFERAAWIKNRADKLEGKEKASFLMRMNMTKIMTDSVRKEYMRMEMESKNLEVGTSSKLRDFLWQK